MTKVSPLAPERFPGMPPVAGVALAAGTYGIGSGGRSDLLLASLVPGTAVAGVLTRSLTASAPVEWCRRALRPGRARGLVANAGNANAFTGRTGAEAVKRTAAAAAALLSCPPARVFVASTGAIGEPLPEGRITARLPALAKALADDAWKHAARAIMTSDTYPKGASRTATIGGTRVTLNGIAKGSGMIAPDMATMLAFIFTDAAIPAGVLQALAGRAADASFNCITVDGDTSTSDTVLLFATGKARHPRVASAADRHLRDFRRALECLMVDLAQQIARDGMGASKFVTITVNGAASRRAARRIGPYHRQLVPGQDGDRRRRRQLGPHRRCRRPGRREGRPGQARDRHRRRTGGRERRPRAWLRRNPGGRPHEGPRNRDRRRRGRGSRPGHGVGLRLTHDYVAINADYRS